MLAIPLIMTATSLCCNDSISETIDLRNADTMSDSIISLSKHYLAAKTNFAVWGLGVANVEGEMQLSKSFSVSLPVWWSPYFIGDKHALRTLAVQPELRYWLHSPGTGHFLGVHIGVAWYNVKWDAYRYQDSGYPLLNTGISYGYSLHIWERLYAEFSIGAGYAVTKYDRFYNIDNGAKIDTRRSSYFGIDKVGISLVYHFTL